MKKKILLLLLLLCGFTSSRLNAQQSKYMALYLMNFTKYIDWTDEQITIGVVGNSPVLLELFNLSEKDANITVKKISGDEAVSNCNLIFLPDAQTRNFNLIQKGIGTAAVILVAENEDLITKGAEMAFFTEDKKLKFFVKKDALNKAGVVMNSRLLSLAKVLD